MNEADIRLAVSHALQWHGYWPYHHQDGRKYFCQFGHMVLAKAEIKGRPDIEARHPRFPTVFIECKAIAKDKKSFEFSQIEPEQRAYMSNWMAEGGCAYIAIGKIMRAGTKSKIGGIYVIPWDWWVKKVEGNLVKSIAWDWDLYEKKPYDWQNRMSIVKLPMHFCMVKATSGWEFTYLHNLAKPPKVEIPFYLREKERANVIIPESGQSPSDIAGNSARVM